jgi:hypothetical protein
MKFTGENISPYKIPWKKVLGRSIVAQSVIFLVIYGSQKSVVMQMNLVNPPGILFLHIFVCIFFVFCRLHMGDQRSARKVLVGRLEGRPRYRWDSYIKIELDDSSGFG